MASLIDFSKPIYGNPTTESVRLNFEIAQSEITTLQTLISSGPFVPLNGGIMQGFLTLHADPHGNFDAATKQYVDSIAFGGGGGGGMPDAPKDGMFYARGGGVTSLATENDWTNAPLFTRVRVGPDKDTTYFNMLYDANYNYYDFNNLDSALRFTRATKLLELMTNSQVIAGFSDSAITLNRQIVSSAGINFGGTSVTDPLDFSRHITLYGGFGGLSVTPNRVNIVSAGELTFVQGGTDVAAFDNLGMVIKRVGNTIRLSTDPSSPLDAVTKQYVDAKQPLGGPYLPLTGGTINSAGNGQIKLGSNVSTFVQGDATGNAQMQSPGASLRVGASGDISMLRFADNAGSVFFGAGAQFYADSAGNFGIYHAGGSFQFKVDHLAYVNQIVLANDPTTAMHAVTKQYSDRNKVTGYADLTSGNVVLNDDQSNYVYFYLYGNPTAPSNLTIAVPGGGRTMWNMLNATSQPAIIHAPGGGQTVTLPSFGQADLSSDSVNMFFANAVGGTYPPGNNTTFLATNEFVTRAVGSYLPLAGGILTGHLTLSGQPTTGLHATTKDYVDTAVAAGSGGTGGIPEAPNDGSVYLRGNLGWTSGGTLTSPLRISVGDGTLGLLLSGLTKGLRFTANSDNFSLEGVDNTGVASYQPLSLGGAAVLLNADTVVSQYVNFTLGRDPTTLMHGVTKQYSDRNKVRGLIDITPGVYTATVSEVDYAYIYIYGSPAGPATITMPVATTVRVVWILNNTTLQPITIQGVGGGAVTIHSGASQAVWTDTGGIYPLYNNGQNIYGTQTINHGMAIIGGGLNFATQFADAPNALNKHLDLYQGWGGFNITSGSLNVVAGGNVQLIFNDAGLTIPAGRTFALDPTVSPVWGGVPTTWSHLVNKQYADTKLSLDGGVVTGPTRFNQSLTVGLGTNSGTILAVDSAETTAPGFAFFSAGRQRWLFAMDHFPNTGDTTPGAGDGAGGENFSLFSYTNSGGYNGQPLTIARDTGQMALNMATLQVARDPTTALEVATKQYVDTKAGQYLPLSGGVLSGGLSLNPVTAISPSDTSKHLDFWSGLLGLNITTARLNYTVGNANSHVFVVDSVDILAINSNGISMGVGQFIALGGDPTTALHAATKQYVDNKPITGGPYLPLVGGTLTGNLVIDVPSSVGWSGLTINHAAGMANYILGKSGGSDRWQMRLGDHTDESGGNVGSNFALVSFNDAGQGLTTPLSITRSGAVSISGQLYVNGSRSVTFASAGVTNPTITCQVPGSYACGFWLETSGTFMGIGQADGVGTPLDNWLILQYAGSRFLQSNMATNYKAGGGPWDVASDQRIKTVTGDYNLGLAEILQLNPIRYRYRGNDSLGKHLRTMHSDTIKEYVGFAAQDVEAIFPEMVSSVPGMIDGEPVMDLRTMNLGSLPMALVNAVKELYGLIDQMRDEITVLKGKQNG